LDYIKTDKLKKVFSERLLQAMLDQGFNSPKYVNKANTQTLADACGVSRQMAARYLNGTAIPDTKVLHRISDWLICDPWWLLFGSKKEEPKVTTTNKISPEIFKFIAAELRILIAKQATKGASHFDFLMDDFIMVYNNIFEIDGNIETKKKSAAVMINFVKSQYTRAVKVKT